MTGRQCGLPRGRPRCQRMLSIVLAVPVARALARRSFFGRGVLITILGAPFILPVIVAVLGLIAVFGRSGYLGNILVWAGLEPISIYGIHGVILAHVFFNLPLATRLISTGLGWQFLLSSFALPHRLVFRPWTHSDIWNCRCCARSFRVFLW